MAWRLRRIEGPPDPSLPVRLLALLFGVVLAASVHKAMRDGNEVAGLVNEANGTGTKREAVNARPRPETGPIVPAKIRPGRPQPRWSNPRPPRRIAPILVDESGEPLGERGVRYAWWAPEPRDPSDPHWISARTDAHGRLHLPPQTAGSRALSILCEGDVNRWRTGSSRDERHRLVPVTLVSFRLRSPDGSPAPGRLRLTSPTAPDWRRRLACDHESPTLLVLSHDPERPSGIERIRVIAETRDGLEAAPVVIPADPRRTRDVEITLPPTIRLRMQITGHARQPLAPGSSLAVSLYRSRPPAPHAPMPRETSGDPTLIPFRRTETFTDLDPSQWMIDQVNPGEFARIRLTEPGRRTTSQDLDLPERPGDLVVTVRRGERDH